MKRQWIFAGLFLVLVGAITAVAIWGPDREWGRDDRRVEVVQVVDDQGNAVDAGNTIIVDRGDRHFSPFGIFFIPLAFLFFFGLFRFAFGGRRGGPCGPGGGRGQWLDEWHRQQHADMESSAPSPPAGQA